MTKKVLDDGGTLEPLDLRDRHGQLLRAHIK